MSESELENNTPQVKYDVFVSFRGEDVRDEFLSHLTEAFNMKKINAFVDDRLEKGEEIWASLVAAIEGSSISLIIFSQHYASSRWCLEELVKILECKDKYGQIVIPVFYKVEPTDVGHQSSHSYKNAFAKHNTEYKSKVQTWRNALRMSSKISGIASSNSLNDAEMVKEIVSHVLKRLTKPPLNLKGLVGIEEKIATIETLMRKEPEETRLVGIWGMGGIGKTTLAEEIFNKLQYEYESFYFLANETEESKKHGIISLKKILFSRLLKCDVKIDTPNSLSEDIVRRIGQMKVFVVLDDVDDFDHLEEILGSLDNFGPGSRILVTTRDKQTLNKANEIYWLEKLSSHEALDLFISKAFNQGDHQRVDNELIERVVNYAQGIPLVVKVLAGLLCGKSKEEWESMLYKLNRMPLTKIYEVMKLSYDSLDRKGQQIFLDLACFFLRTHVLVDVESLKCLLKDDENDYSVAFELGRLIDKALITISEDNIISMHDSLQEMAWEIVRQESTEDPGSRSRLWDLDDVLKALQNGKVTEAIRSIIIDMKTIEETNLMHDIFAKMSRLKFLEIVGYPDGDIEGFQFLPSELRFLYWWKYPLKSLPENFLAEKLVILILKRSTMEKLWDGVKNLINLKVVDLSFSKELVELPDFSKASNLEALILEACLSLTSVHSSIFSLPKLESLNLQNCKSLTVFASHSHLTSLIYLDLKYCDNLRKFSISISENMIYLSLACTKVKELALLFGHQSKLRLLDQEESDIESLASTLNSLKKLLYLEIRDCEKLQIITDLPQSLEILDARGCRSLQSICKLSQCLKTLDVSWCSSLQSLPKLSQCLTTLDASSCSSLQNLPELPHCLTTLDVSWCSSLQSLPKLPKCLKTLDVRGCSLLEALPELPPSLEVLYADECESLKNVLLIPSTMVEQLKENKKRVRFTRCFELDEHSLKAIELNAQMNIMKFAHRHLFAQNHDKAIYVYPGSSVPEWFNYKTTNDYIIIDDLSSQVLAFIFCLVIYENSYHIGREELKMTVCDGEGESKSDTLTIDDFYIYSPNHVYVMFHKKCSDFLISKAKDLVRFQIHVAYKRIPKQGHIKGFGVSPLNTRTYDNLVQQMKLRDSLNHFQ